MASYDVYVRSMAFCWRDSGDLLIPLKPNQEAESKSQLLGGFGVGSDRE